MEDGGSPRAMAMNTTCYFIRRKGDSDSYWNSRDGWTDRTQADLHGHGSLKSPHINVPPDGVWVDSYHGSYDQQEDAGIAIDPRIRPNFPFRPNGRHVPKPRYSPDRCLVGDAGKRQP